MLPEPLRILISAYATGELSPRRRAAAVRLLRHSGDARALLRVLRHNRRRLRALPRPALPVNFTANVVGALPSQPPIIQPLPIIYPSQPRASAAARWAAAAVVLVAVAIGAYLIGALPRETDAPSRAIANRSRPKPQTDVAQLPRPDARRDDMDLPNPIDLDQERVPGVEERNSESTSKPGRGTVVSLPIPDPLGSTSPPPSTLTTVPPPRLLAMPLRDLDGQDSRAKLEQEFARGDAHHIDLFGRDSTHAFDRLQTAMKARGIKLVVDSHAQEALKRKLRTQYLIYCDDMTAAEWSRMLQSLAAGDKKPGEGVFDHIVVVPFDTADQNELKAVAGSDLTQPDARRSGPGNNGKKEAKEALVAWLAPVRTPANPKDVRQFLDAHRDRAAGDIAVVLVLRLPGS
jgi:hypothetical protein